MKFGYALIVVTVGLMIWASSVGAVAVVEPPCGFNSLCTCTNAYSDHLGKVSCVNVPFPTLPYALNNSKAYSLRMDGTGLTELDASFLRLTGLYRLELSNNPLAEILEGAFNGLERSLRELILKNDGLVEFPTRALRFLTKLNHLDLSSNDISLIERECFRGLQNSLETLILADNVIVTMPIDAFHGLPNLKNLDLSSNNLHVITPDVFREQMNSLETVNFANNLLSEIPYGPVSMLRRLRVLDLSSNRILGFDMPGELQPMNVKLSLDQLHLEHNEIDGIPQ